MFYTNHSDSSFLELKESGIRPITEIDSFDEFSIDNDCILKYVLVRVSNPDKIPFEIARKFRIIKLRDNWYYFRKFTCSNVEDF